ncbi:MAG: peptide deformylase [Alphaproteobacteria bacterium RIFCSPHIGHO2_12_FULL_63_12]|nr:MAG: peptide deformylase [Alphaproteobacteria bacterium RIFCSPHIGHO2_12_FULL_63_12]
MTIREILTAPDPRLRQVSAPVEVVDDGVRALMDDMLETMYEAEGIGLAAIQVNVAKRIIVMDLAGEGEDPRPTYFVNPEILDPSEETNLYQEGCLSVPEFWEEVERPARCRVRFLDYFGKEQTLDAEGMLATCIQHEMDHLNGVLFIDHISRLKRDRIIRKLKKEQRLAATA